MAILRGRNMGTPTHLPGSDQERGALYTLCLLVGFVDVGDRGWKLTCIFPQRNGNEVICPFSLGILASGLKSQDFAQSVL